MGDEQVGELQLLAQLLEQVDDPAAMGKEGLHDGRAMALNNEIV